MSEAPLLAWMLDRAHVAVPVDLGLYSLDAVMRAAYKLTDRCYAFLARPDDGGGRLVVYLIGRAGGVDLTTTTLEFQNELLDQQLRCRLEAQFADVRTLVVAQAFSEGNLIDPEADEGDYRGDPLGAGRQR